VNEEKPLATGNSDADFSRKSNMLAKGFKSPVGKRTLQLL
jgi:hypothetical protein